MSGFIHVIEDQKRVARIAELEAELAVKERMLRLHFEDGYSTWEDFEADLRARAVEGSEDD